LGSSVYCGLAGVKAPENLPFRGAFGLGRLARDLQTLVGLKADQTQPEGRREGRK
jgi:hypothetical protein